MSEAAGGHVLRERPCAAIAIVRIHRPERRNALSMEVRRQIAAAVAAAAASCEVRAIVLAGSATCFASGGDIVENARLDAMENLERGREKRALWQTLSACEKPIIAAVRGYALGGGAELMMLADVVVAAADARIGQPELRVGIMPGSGGTQRLPRAVGKYAAMKLLLTAGWVSGAEAARMGLVSVAVADEQVEACALEIASTVAAHPPRAVAAAKQAVLAAGDTSLEAGLLLESRSFTSLAGRVTATST